MSSLVHSGAFLAHFAQCKVSAKQQVNSMIDAIYAKVLLDLELWLNKHQSNHSVHALALNHNEPTGEQMQFMSPNTQQIPGNVYCPPTLPPSNFGHHSNDSIKSEIDSDCEENVTDNNNLSGDSQFDHQNNLQNELSLSNITRTESITKELDDEEYGEEIDDDSVAKCENCENGICTLGDDAELGQNGDESSKATQVDIETNFDEAQFDIDINVTDNTQMNNQNDEENDINERSVSERNMERSTPSTSGVRSSTRKRIQTKVFGDLVQSNGNTRKCGKRKSDQANESGDKMKPKYVLEVDDDTDSDDQVNGQNSLETIFDTRATIGNHSVCNSDESMAIQQEERDAISVIGEEIATKCTTNPIQPNLAQPNYHLQCSHCHKSFDHKHNFQKHLRVHTGERPFCCDQCDQRFKQQGNLARHQQMHQNLKRFKCDQCDKQFIQKVTLERHQRTHSGERLFQCNFCQKSFTELRNQKRHEQAIHLHVKPYRCKQCGHTATQQSAIIRHIRVVHFGLPQSIKDQRALNIIDHRDPKELVEKV